MSQIVSSGNKYVIYRASPNTKQLYISFLQKNSDKETMMIGDGSNDISAIVQANIGIGIKNEDNYNVQNIAEIIVDNWNKIPQLLDDFDNKKIIVTNVAQWVLMKHMISAFMLLTILFISRFQSIKDPTSPYLMSTFNILMFICMYIYCSYTENYKVLPGFIYMIIKGAVLGIINVLFIYMLVDIVDNINLGIKILILVQALELIFQIILVK